MNELKFKCPECSSDKLGQVNTVIVTYPITRILNAKIPSDDDLDYDLNNTVSGGGEVLAYQCMNCGYELKNDDIEVVDVIDVPEWILKNCPQED